jgi:UDP-N-acetyl-D-glucosamine dehydrogenase
VKSEDLRRAVDSGLFKAYSNYSVVSDMDCVIICVPTPLRHTKDPDMSHIVDATQNIARRAHKNMLVVLQSTTYPGTTNEILLPEFHTDHLQIGKDLFVAFSPERVDPGNPVYNTRNTPKIVGGVTPACTEMAKTLYEQALETVIPVSSTAAAEMVKLLENTFRSVNIGLVNEVAIICEKLGVNVWEVIGAAATKPFGFMPFYPGPGLGGHCIPIDPIYLSWKLKALNYNARFIELASDVNTHMPEYCVSRISRILNQHRKCVNGSRILVLGVAYKKDITDMRESPALDVIRLLQAEKAWVDYSDPYVPELELDGKQMQSVELTSETVAGYDMVAVVTDHSCFDYGMIQQSAQVIFDSRNAYKGEYGNVVKL